MKIKLTAKNIISKGAFEKHKKRKLDIRQPENIAYNFKLSLLFHEKLVVLRVLSWLV